MIDLRRLREDPQRYKQGATDKGITVDIDELLELDQRLRAAQTELQQLITQKNRIGRDIGRIAGLLKKASNDDQRTALGEQMKAAQQRPAAMKKRESELNDIIAATEPKRDDLWLAVPQPADSDVPIGASAEDNIEISTWHPDWFDPAVSFQDNRGFAPRTHIEMGRELGLFDIERGVRMAGSRSYVLTGNGMRLHQAVLRYAYDFMINEHGFSPLSVPVIVRDDIMIGTGFFPEGRDQAYEIPETTHGGGHDLYLTGTGEVGLMGFHKDEILDADQLPVCYTTLSTCFRREAGAAGKDTAGLYRIHQFDKVEQVVLCRADVAQSRAWHQKMIGFVETLMQRLELPYRLLQCCTGDLGPKNADMIDIETWMPGRGPDDNDGRPTGAYGETHSASRLYDYQCRRLNIRYKDADTGKNRFCHSLNNTVAASPRILIPILELYQNKDGSVTVPEVLRPYMNGIERME